MLLTMNPLFFLLHIGSIFSCNGHGDRKIIPLLTQPEGSVTPQFAAL